MVVRQQRDRMSRGLSVRAQRAGLAGMSEELAGRPRARGWFQHSGAFSWWRDRVKP
jgi:ribosome modulation factor